MHCSYPHDVAVILSASPPHRSGRKGRLASGRSPSQMNRQFGTGSSIFTAVARAMLLHWCEDNSRSSTRRQARTFRSMKEKPLCALLSSLGQFAFDINAPPNSQTRQDLVGDLYSAEAGPSKPSLASSADLGTGASDPTSLSRFGTTASWTHRVSVRPGMDCRNPKTRGAFSIGFRRVG